MWVGRKKGADTHIDKKKEILKVDEKSELENKPDKTIVEK